MDNRNTLCDRCGRHFAGNRGLNIHQNRSRVCVNPDQNQEIEPVARPPEQPEIEDQEEQDDDNPGFFTPEEGFLDVIEIDCHVLNYIAIPANMFRNLENEQQIDGRYWSLAQFAAALTVSRYQKKRGVIEDFIRVISYVLFSVYWIARIVSIASASLALYYCYKGQLSSTVHHIVGFQ